jgi:hypothetical protein
MITEYTSAVESLQELFLQMNNEGKITPDQAAQFDEAQRVLFNFHTWVKNQLNGNLKVTLPWEDTAFVEAWALWKKFKKEKNFTYKPIGEQSALHRLTELSGGDMAKAIAILKQSRENGWSGLFELKDTAPRYQRTNPSEPRNVDYKQNLFNRLTQQK